MKKAFFWISFIPLFVLMVTIGFAHCVAFKITQFTFKFDRWLNDFEKWCFTDQPKEPKC